MKLRILLFFFFCSIGSGILHSQDSLTFAVLRNIAEQPDFFLRSELDNFKTREGDLKMTYYMEPYNVSSGHFGLQYILTTLRDYPDIEFDLLYDYSNASQGSNTLTEIRVQLAIEREYPNLFFDYLINRGENLSSPWQEIALNVGIDTLVIANYLQGAVDFFVSENYYNSQIFISEREYVYDVYGNEKIAIADINGSFVEPSSLF